MCEDASLTSLSPMRENGDHSGDWYRFSIFDLVLGGFCLEKKIDVRMFLKVLT